MLLRYLDHGANEMPGQAFPHDDERSLLLAFIAQQRDGIRSRVAPALGSRRHVSGVTRAVTSSGRGH